MPSLYPPLVDTPWVLGDEERLIKLTMHGLWGDIEVNGETYGPSKGSATDDALWLVTEQ